MDNHLDGNRINRCVNNSIIIIISNNNKIYVQAMIIMLDKTVFIVIVFG